jgi:hypothetical protein
MPYLTRWRLGCKYDFAGAVVYLENAEAVFAASEELLVGFPP